MLDSTNVFQGGDKGNRAYVVNDVNSAGKTGYNNANRNTGDVFSRYDPVDVVTGHSMGDTSVNTSTNANMYGPVMHLPGGWDLSVGFDLNHLWSQM
jgi:hypothetical protein